MKTEPHAVSGSPWRPWTLDDDHYYRLRGRMLIPLYLAMLAFVRPGPAAAWEIALGGALVTGGLGLRAAARLHIGRGSDTRRLHAQRLITTGPYALIRNPLYAANGSIAIGLVIVAGAIAWAPILAIALTLHYARVIRAEERMLARTFGAVYESYRRDVPRVVPDVSQLSELPGVRHLRREARITLLALAGIPAILGLRYLASALLES
jgi:protein-S-isoprenylcysteine O-methyltransferase Ste14